MNLSARCIREIVGKLLMVFQYTSVLLVSSSTTIQPRAAAISVCICRLAVVTGHDCLLLALPTPAPKFGMGVSSSLHKALPKISFQSHNLCRKALLSDK
jgi:hypothetical protein